MQRRSSFGRLMVSMLAAGALFGCAGPSPVTAPEPVAAQTGGPSRALLMDSEAYGKRLAELLERLDLSETQQQALKGVIEEAFDISRPMLKLFKALVADPAVDQETLEAGLATLLQLDAVQDAQTMASLRGMLTDKQRQEVAKAIPELMASRELQEMLDEVTDKFGTEIGLNAEQRQKLTRAMADFETFWQANEETLLTAMATHMTEGGQLELQQTFAAVNRTYDTASLAAFLTSLDRAQRQKLNTAVDALQAQVLERL